MDNSCPIAFRDMVPLATDLILGASLPVPPRNESEHRHRSAAFRPWHYPHSCWFCFRHSDMQPIDALNFALGSLPRFLIWATYEYDPDGARRVGADGIRVGETGRPAPYKTARDCCWTIGQQSRGNFAASLFGVGSTQGSLSVPGSRRSQLRRNFAAPLGAHPRQLSGAWRVSVARGHHRTGLY